MRTFVALFRGINVGGKNKLPMKDLVSLMENTGLKNVRTYIQSGNVVFQTADSMVPDLDKKIQDSILGRHGLSLGLVILDKNEVDRSVSENPFPEAASEPKSVHLTFLSALPTNPDIEALERIRVPSERFALHEKVFYLHAPEGIGRSKLAAKIEKALGVSCTSRNWRTVLKLQEMIRTDAGAADEFCSPQAG